MQKIKISDYMLLSQEDRQSHIDLSTNCQYHIYTKEYNHKGTIKQIGDLYGGTEQTVEAKRRLLEYLNIEDFNGYDINLCHKCKNCSSKNKICVSPLHTYFGTVLENQLDIPEDVRRARNIKGGKMSGKSHYENGTGFFGMTEQERTIARSKAGKSSYEKGAGFFGMSDQEKFEASSKGGKKAYENGRGPFQQKIECPHCKKIGHLVAMKRWHFDNCKFKK